MNEKNNWNKRYILQVEHTYTDCQPDMALHYFDDLNELDSEVHDYYFHTFQVDQFQGQCELRCRVFDSITGKHVNDWIPWNSWLDNEHGELEWKC